MPARVQSVKLTGKTFERPQKFSLAKRLRDSFGVRSGEGEYEVVIRFNARAADYVREKKWHESQQLRELKGGGVELRIETFQLDGNRTLGFELGRRCKSFEAARIGGSRQEIGGGDTETAGLKISIRLVL